MNCFGRTRWPRADQSVLLDRSPWLVDNNTIVGKILILREAAMQPEQLYNLLEEQPFRPRRVYLKDGRTYDIPLRDMVVVGVHYVDIGLQAPEESAGICSGIVTFAPEDI